MEVCLQSKNRKRIVLVLLVLFVVFVAISTAGIVEMASCGTTTEVTVGTVA